MVVNSDWLTQAACELEDMLEDFSKLEVLDEYNCRRCSIQATLDRLRHQSDASRPEAGTDVTPSKKKRMREVQKQINRLKACLDEENVEKEFAELRLERAPRPATKQCMFSRVGRSPYPLITITQTLATLLAR